MADFLNDQLQRPSNDSSQQRFSPTEANPNPAGYNDSEGATYVPRPKRIACVVCRRRKLRCDGKKPSCGTCSRLGHECAYDEVRKKSGPKRGYVKQLEARLAQVETLLKTQEGPSSQTQANTFAITASNDLTNIPDLPAFPEGIDEPPSPPGSGSNNPQNGQIFLPPVVNRTGAYGWDMISLGLEEPLPTREVVDELNQIYFEKIHPSQPILHRPRHLASMNLPPNIRPPVCLQYITWCHAASVSEKYCNLHSLFYERARKYAELDEMKGLGEGICTLAHCQTWSLISSYEFRMMFFPRAWLSGGKAGRLALMLGLNRIDGAALDVKQTLPPAKDWTEREERRRVFWMAFCIDRYASVGTGWPVLMDERDIMTNLPASEEAFVQSQPQRTARFTDIITGEGMPTLSAFGSVVMMAILFGRNLSHLHRPEPQENDHDLNGGYWQRHRSYDNILLHFALTMPSHIRLPAGILDPNVIFCNMAIHTSTICLHQAAIFKAEKNQMPEQIIIESKRRCIVAADQISNIMKMISHVDLTTMNPFLSFCVYIAARVFVQYLKSRPDDTAARSSLQFVFSALDALKNKNPLTESFLVQLDVDIEGTPLSDLRQATRGSTGEELSKDPAYLKIIKNCKFTNEIQSARRALNKPSAQPSPTNPLSSSLPSRQKPRSSQHDSTRSSSTLSGDGYSFPRHQQQHSFNPLNPGPDTTTTSANIPGATTTSDMDMAPEFTDTASSSDFSSAFPLTDTATTRKHPQQQAPASSLDNTALDLSMGSGLHDPYMDIAISTRALPTGIITPLESTTSDGSIPLPSTWDFSTNTGTAPSAPNVENIDMSMVAGMDTFGEAQWAQMLGSNWQSWPNNG